ncbi:MAG TPA: hypothetical protein VGJ29_00365 [Vicinamibacterales bacterium]
MKKGHRRAMITSAAVGMMVVATLSVRAARVPLQVTTAAQVQTLGKGDQVVVPPGQKGATYYWLESQTKKLTTRFSGVTATAERDAYGKLNTTLVDSSGNEIAHFQVHRPDGLHDMLRYVNASGSVLQAVGDPAVHATLDWSNQQLYHLWKDNVDPAATKLQWQDGMMRPRGAAARNAERDILELETEWAGGLTAQTVRKVATHHEAVKGRFVDGEALATRLTDSDGAEIGVSYWYSRPQLYVWSLPSVRTGGFIGPEHLHADYGGWPFVPDMAWMNLQALAFHHFKGLINTQRFVARARPRTGGILQFFEPTLSANEDGCDDLHWLDNTVFRFCCDQHDRCYEKAGCDSRSWWRFWTSWLCDFCNEEVIRCFLSGGLGSGGPGKLA